VSVGEHDPSDYPTGDWNLLRPMVASRLADPRVQARLCAPYRVDGTCDIPYVCAISEDWATLFHDLNCPIASAPIGKNNMLVDVTPFIWLHECGEKCFIELFDDMYLFAHKYITIAEHDAVVAAGINWRRYCAFFDAYDNRDEHKLLTCVPRTIYQRPYRDSGDWALLQRMIDVMA
jgi:hypothetical protein